MFCILMKFGTVVDLNKKPRLQKTFQKAAIVSEVMTISNKCYFSLFRFIAHT